MTITTSYKRAGSPPAPIAMQKQTIDLAVGSSLTRLVAVLSAWIAQAPARVTIEPIRDTRSIQMNSYLWGVVYPTILKEPLLAGWRDKDIHEYFLGEFFGWQRLEGLGLVREVPKRRSSKLTTGEFTEYAAYLKRAAAQRFGLYIPDPDPSLRTR